MDRSPVRGVARLAAILDSLPEALLLVDGGGRVVNANAVAVGWFEAPGAPLVGRPVTDLLSGFGTALARVASPDPTAGVWTDPGESGPGSVSGGDAGVPTRMVAKLADGSAFPAEVVRSFLPAGHGGLEVVVVRDVSGVADAEAELRRQQRQTELILRAASEGIVGVDTGGRVVLVNPAAARVLKYRASELGGLEFDALIGGSAPGEPSPVADTLRTGRKHRLGSEAGLHLIAKGGGTVPVELSTAPVMEDDALVGAVVTFVDLSRFRLPAVQTPQVPNGAGGPGGHPGVGAFSGANAFGGGTGINGSNGTVLSAESVSALRRPLDAARTGLARLANTGDALTPGTRHQLAHVTAELAEAARLVEELLDAAAGPTGLRKRPAELGRIVHAATDAATDLAGAAGIDLAVHTGPAEVVIDAERMTQAVRHLLVDTVQASPPGSTVVVAAARRGPIARIEVRGAEVAGVPEHLSFARTVVERHGGQLTVHRVDGKGVTYVIELPVGAEGENELASGASSASRNLVEETRIIPIVREIESAEPAGALGGRRRGDSAAATTTTIPRQIAPPEEQLGDRGELAERGHLGFGQTTHVPAGASASGNGAAAGANGSTETAPRGRRRAAHQAAAANDSYLIQHVESSGDAALRTSGSYQDEAALATSGNFTPEAQKAQQAASLYGDPVFREPDGGDSRFGAPRAVGSGSLYGPDPAQPLFRDEVPGADAAGAGPGAQPGTMFAGDARGELFSVPKTSSPFGDMAGFGNQASDGVFGTGARGSEAVNGSQGVAFPPAGEAQAPLPFLSEAQAQNSGFTIPEPFDPNSKSSDRQTSGLSPAVFPPQQSLSPQPPAPFLTEAQTASPFGALPPSPFAAPKPAVSEAAAWPNPEEPDPAPQGVDAWPAPGGEPRGAAPTLLVWPTPETGAEQVLAAQGYAPTALKAPAQLSETGAARPVALLADPVGVPVTRAALHTLRAAAADSGIPLFVTAGLGAVPVAAMSATARRGADPSALLRALTPEQVSAPRVLLIEENPDLAASFAISLERDGMRVIQAASENDAMAAMVAEHPQLIVMDMTLVRRRRSGVIDWLRTYERLHLAPTVLYTVPASMTTDAGVLRALRSGEAVVHLVDREVGPEAAQRIGDLMGKIVD
ncbi:PAS domain-containing protein [Catenulispora rubra]|uniref:PAS domain-containing protein n=1 Tax=Catenulispora rubra TaxID=280293 RepID=UPI0018923CA2|nr:PAS domain-containing protein [Catenulispora rubra]